MAASISSAVIWCAGRAAADAAADAGAGPGRQVEHGLHAGIGVAGDLAVQRVGPRRQGRQVEMGGLARRDRLGHDVGVLHGQIVTDGPRVGDVQAAGRRRHHHLRADGELREGDRGTR